jgi:hypothetical protein
MTLSVEEALELLRRLDDPRFTERPKGFDERAAATRFKELLARLNQTFNCEVASESWPDIQDASYYGQAKIPTGSTETGADIAVRVSNFGNLAVYALELLGAYDDAERELLMSERDRDRVETALADCGYVALPEDILWEPYDGANQGLLDHHARAGYEQPTWFLRYFGFL